MLKKFFNSRKEDRGATAPEYAIVFAIMVGVALSSSSCLELVTSLQTQKYAKCVSEIPPPDYCVLEVATTTTEQIIPTTTTTTQPTTTTTAPTTSTTSTTTTTTTTTTIPPTTTTTSPDLRYMIARGGLVVDSQTDPKYRFHIFTKTGANTFDVTNLGETGEIEAIVVGGGGGGGAGSRREYRGAGGGGGGGGVVISSINLSEEGPYRVSVGAGGLGAKESAGNNGGLSMIHPESLVGRGWEPILWALTNNVLVYGGGGGGGGSTETSVKGKSGGSGGGGGAHALEPLIVNNSLRVYYGSAGKKSALGFANDGSQSTFLYLWIALGLAGGGGGGAGGPATNNDDPNFPGWNSTGFGGNGGGGINASAFLNYKQTSSIFGCGGAGAGWVPENNGSGTPGCNSAGRAARGGLSSVNSGAAAIGGRGTANSGSGGGGVLFGEGGAGGSGIVVIRYKIS